MNKSFEIISDNENNDNDNKIKQSKYYNLVFDDDDDNDDDNIETDLTINSMWDNFEIKKTNEIEEKKDLSTSKIHSNSVKLLKIYLQHVNNYINIYNLNVYLYKNTLDILDKYFTSIFNQIEMVINNTCEKLKEFKKYDINNNIYRDYDPIINLFKNIIYIYIIMILTDKIQKIEKYILNVEKNLSTHSWLLIKAIWYFYYFPKYGVLPNKDIYDSNFTNSFEKVKRKIFMIVNENMTKFHF